MYTNLLDSAMKMPPKDRVELAELILESIDYEEEKIKNIWIAEVKKRMKAVEEGKSKLLSFDQIYNEG